MKAWVYSRAWDIALRSVDAPKILSPTDVIVEIKATGICGTDLGIITGEYQAVPGTIIGHEAAGLVVDVGTNVDTLNVGDRVAIDPTYFCGLCRLCRTDRSNHCETKGQTETGVSSHGTFAKFYRTKARFLYPLQDHVSFEEASLTEPLSCALTGVNQLRLNVGYRTVVVGGGPMGLLYSLVLASRGLSGTVVDHSPERLELCANIIAPSWSVAEDVEDVVRQYNEPRPLDLLLDTTGYLAEKLVPLLASGGTFLAVGLKNFRASIEVGEIANRSLTLAGSIDSLNNSFNECVHLIASGAIPVRKFVSHQVGLEELPDMLALLGLELASGSKRKPSSVQKIIIHP